MIRLKDGWIRVVRYFNYKVKSDKLDFKFVHDMKLLPALNNATVNVIGYIRYNYSSSSDVRRIVQLLKKTSTSFCTLPIINTKKQIVMNSNDYTGYNFTTTPTGSINLFFINADHIRSVYNKNRQLFMNRYNIAIYWWEFTDYFYFRNAFKFIDEVVVYSQLVYDAIVKVIPSNIKLTKLTYPFIPQKLLLSPSECRTKLLLPMDEFIVLFNFDVHSSVERKNPHAVIDVIKQALPHIPHLHLVLKISNYDFWREGCLELTSYLENSGIGKQNYTLITNSLSDDEMLWLLNSCDVYISLHRTEGLGLGMLEAMSLGKPVIATKFGGNLEFMTEQNSILIDYKLCAVKQTFASYKQGYLWADPSTEQAVNSLIKLASDATFYEAVSAMAERDIYNKYNLDKIVVEMEQFINSRLGYTRAENFPKDD